MVVNNAEKRLCPRIKTHLKADLSNKIRASVIDFSENGLSFSLSKDLYKFDNSDKSNKSKIRKKTLPVHFSLKICLPDNPKDFKTKARIVWNKSESKDIDLFGAEFLDISDVKREFLRKALIKLQIDQFLNKDLELSEKNEITHFFANDVLDYMNEITDFCDCFGNRKKIPGMEKRLEHINDKILLKGYCLEELLSDKMIMEKVKDNFRKLTGTWVYKSIIVKKALESAAGYKRDYKVTEMIYENKPVSENIGFCFDKVFLKSPYAVAIRQRKDKLRENIKDFIEYNPLAQINILNLNCGSCREIRELLVEFKTEKHIIFTCLESNVEALEFLRDSVLDAAPDNIEFKLIKKDVLDLIHDKLSAQCYGKKDLIYSINLMDYLEDNVLIELIKELYELLAPGGKLILTHKNKEKTFAPIAPDWFCNWSFVPRSKDEAMKLFYTAGFSHPVLSVDSDDFGFTYFFTFSKAN